MDEASSTILSPNTTDSSVSESEPLSQSLRKCIIHSESCSQSEPILPLQEKHWSAITNASKSRSSKAKFHTSKYYNIIRNLPQEPNEFHGYHIKCYKNFTAVVTLKGTEEKVPNQEKKTLRSPSSCPKATESSTGIFPVVCLFCNTVRRHKKEKFEFLGSCETKEAAESIQNAARVLVDEQILAKIAGVDLIAKEAKYHHSCKSAFLMKADRQRENRNDTSMNETEKCNTQCNSFDIISLYVQKSILSENRPELLTSVYSRYFDFCEESGEEAFSSAQYLLKSLQRKFGEKLKVQSSEAKKAGTILHSSASSVEAVRHAFDYASSEEGLLNKAALVLRKKLKSLKRKDLWDNPKVESFAEGEASPPSIVENFFTVLYGGPDLDKHSLKVKRAANSSSQDALFLAQGGLVKPAKHILLGCAIKSITGSKKVVTILNRLGHCVNYNCIEEIETTLASKYEEQDQTCPDGTKRFLPMGLAFDNYDELTSTLSGAETLHDTMGILYQNIGESELVITDGTKSTEKTKRRKRRLDTEEQDLMPYRKKPKMTIFSYDEIDITCESSASMKKGNSLDFAWMASHALDIEGTPMWVGFNSKICIDRLPKQIVHYMPNIRFPITSLDVVQETLNITQRCATECRQEYGIVTYDLNAAKPAFQIQATDHPKFSNIFIMPGAFHIEIAFFRALGKLIAESGGPTMLTETEVLSKGSLNGVLQAKNFNRCKRLHPLLALAFEVLHFQAFWNNFDQKETMIPLLNSLKDGNGEDAWQEVESAEVFKKCEHDYRVFTAKTRSGDHGATAQFWLMYVDFMHDYHRLERSIRTNDVDLFTEAITAIIGLFFMMNHSNYARWLSKFQLDMNNIDKTNPGLRSILNEGVFTVRRTDHNFSRLPVDLTLEQTVNADAASRTSGITSMTNSYSTRLRWMITKSARAEFVSKVQEMVGITKTEDVTSDLTPARLQRNAKDLQKVIRQIKETHNPFMNEIDRDQLINISTGKVASEGVKEFLLSVPAKGHERHKEFIEACQANPKRFEEPIKRVKLVTFEKECAVNRRTTSKKVQELRCTRDLMGRLAVIASQRRLDLEAIFAYPLTPVPLCLFAGDGTMIKTDKSALFKELEKRVEPSTPPSNAPHIIDGNFLLHLLPSNKATTYGKLARMMIHAISFSNRRVDLVFDRYSEPSIKDSERGRRGVHVQEYVISGTEQKCPKNLQEALKSTSFKINLPLFLVNEWEHQEYAEILRKCDLFVGVEDSCYHFFVEDNVMMKEDIQKLRSNHNEADTRVCLHVKDVDSTTYSDKGI